MFTYGAGGAGFFFGREAGEEVAGVVFLLLQRVFLLRPVALDGDGGADARQPGIDGGDGGDGPAPQIQPPVFAFVAQEKRGVPVRAWRAPVSRREVFSLVPMR